MKQARLIETGILIVALVILYQLITAFIGFLLSLFLVSSAEMGGMPTDILLTQLFPLLLYLFAIFLLVKYKKNLTSILCGKSEEENAVIVSFSGKQLLHASIIVVCLVQLINEIPIVVSWIVQRYTKSNELRDEYGGIVGMDWPASFTLYTSIARIIIILIFALLAKRLSHSWSNKQDNPVQ